MSTNIYIKTYGCTLNTSDSELMAGLLKKADFKIVDNSDDAFVIIINTCAVKSPTQEKFFSYLEKLKKRYKYKKIIITGCIPQTMPKKLKSYPLLGTSQITNIVQLVEEVLHENPVKILKRENFPRLNLPKIRKNKIIEIIPICEGCLGAPCSYCIVKKARGNLRSYPKEEIIKQARKALIKDNVKELWLTAQDTGCYGKDINSSLPELLDELIKIPKEFKIRLGMLNPNHAYELLDKLIKIYRSDKMFKFLHIPVQSGNDEILKEMKRNYTSEQFKEIIKRFRAEIPNISIATDIIVGFPGETEEQFQDSLNLIKETVPDVLNRNRYWKRPKTPAAKMKNQIDNKEKKRRSSLLTDIFKNISRMRNERWLGWTGTVLIDEKGKDNSLIARNFAYKPVIIKGDYKIGDKIKVQIKKITPFDLRTF